MVSVLGPFLGHPLVSGPLSFLGGTPVRPVAGGYPRQACSPGVPLDRTGGTPQGWTGYDAGGTFLVYNDKCIIHVPLKPKSYCDQLSSRPGEYCYFHTKVFEMSV